MPTRRASSSLALLLLAACGGPPSVEQVGEASASTRSENPRPWFGRKSGLDNAPRNFSAGPEEVNGPPQFEMIEHYPATRPDALLKRFAVTTTDPAGDGAAKEAVVECLRGIYAGKSAADFGALVEAAGEHGWTKPAGEEGVFLDEKLRRVLILAPARADEPGLPEGIKDALVVDLCRHFSPKMELGPIKAPLVYDWRMTPIHELSKLLARAPRELDYGRIGDRWVAGGSFAIGAADEAAVTKWITDHGFAEGAAAAGQGRRFTLGDDALRVEVTLTGGEAGQVRVRTTER